MKLYNRLVQMIGEIVMVVQHHSSEERIEVLKGAGVYHEDGGSHIHIERAKPNEDENSVP